MESEIEAVYKKWCSSTKRSGGVLIGSSIRDLMLHVLESPSLIALVSDEVLEEAKLKRFHNGEGFEGTFE
jgi:hypothetical protein